MIRIKRIISLTLAAIMITLTLPMGDFISYGEEIEVEDIEKIESISIVEGENRLRDNKFLINDFQKDKTNIKFKLNIDKDVDEAFLEKIDKIKFVRESDGKTVEVEKGKIDEGEEESEDNKTFIIEEEEIFIYLSDNAREKLSYGVEFEKCENRKTAAGKYKIHILMDGQWKYLKIKQKKENDEKEDREYESLIIKDKPRIEYTYPRANSEYFNPEYLYEKFTEDDGEVEKGYYLRAKFENIGDTLGFIESDGRNPMGIRVNIVGNSENIVDMDKKLQFKSSNLYIPIKEKLEDGREYEVYIEEGRYLEYREYRFYEEDKLNYRNKCYSWKFGTKPMPVWESLFEGAVVEDYDTGYPIVIDGKDFISGVEVYFEDNRGDRYWADRVRLRTLDDDNKRLYIYLPRGRDKLYPGEYKIIIRNGSDHQSEINYGNFSVIKEGDQTPSEENFIREDKYYGDVYALREQSSDKLELRSSDRNRNYLRIDLDEIMGEDTWSRSIEYPAGYGDSIGTLFLESKWADVEIRNLRLDYNYNRRTIDLKVGRAAPGILGNLKSKLTNVDIKSDFIEVQGENTSFDNVRLEIPYENSDGDGLRLLRYDQFSRSFFTIPSITDEINGTLSGVSNNPGIFVIVK